MLKYNHIQLCITFVFNEIVLIFERKSHNKCSFGESVTLPK